jgi:hypothetical protein
LVSLAVAFAWVGRWILIKESHSKGYSLDKYVEVTNIAIFSSVAMYLFFAIYEIRQWKDKFWPFIGSLLLVALTGVLSFFGLRWLDIRLLKLHPENPRTWCYFVMFTILFIVGAMIYSFLKGFYKKIFISLTLPLVSVPLLLYLRSFIPLPDKLFSGIKAAASTLGQHDEYFLASIIACAVAVGLIRWLWDEKTNRSIFLVAFTYLILVSFLLFTCFAHSQYKNRALLAYLTLGLVFIAISWSVACGWMSDPNYLSMHTFYKSRLVRAYLGASNPNREEKEITDSAAEDDILLSNLKNCERGAPYHLVNTTLNLVGGRDLASAQRSSANFVFSKLYSGSSRTGYRRNLPEQYMQGQMTLGTAVAISGAAVSPNMGAKTQTSAVAMLLTLLNVRLGFWAPTPNHKSWRSSQAGLWPFYMLREFLSQTNDLSNYCYLTDGGHFDNTGLYSLIERGCRFIVVVDNGADPNNFFEDLGDAIRRCRIDFKSKINLDITQLFKKKDELSGDGLAQKHFIVGTLKYTEDHLSSLGWNEAQIKNNRKGVIILIKPSLVLGDSLDLRQYKWQNRDFPQQSTADQWYDEAQFESYRKLGKWCAQSMVQHLELDTRLGNATQLSPEDISKAIDKAEKKFNREKTGTKPSVLDPPI